MRLVVVESPYRGDVEMNVEYARLAILNSLERGESPIASHLLFPQAMGGDAIGDKDPTMRLLGIMAGTEWIRVCDAVVVYGDLGVTEGMQAAISVAAKYGKPVELRKFLDADTRALLLRLKREGLV